MISPVTSSKSDRRRDRHHRDLALVRQGQPQRPTRGLNTTATASTTPIRTISRTSPASRSATTPATAIPRSRSCSRCSRPRPNFDKRRKIVWEIDRSFWKTVRARHHGTARHLQQPYVKATSSRSTASTQRFRFEDVWSRQVTSTSSPSPVLRGRYGREASVGMRAVSDLKFSKTVFVASPHPTLPRMTGEEIES